MVSGGLRDWGIEGAKGRKGEGATEIEGVSEGAEPLIFLPG